jgi:hypothetical protein
MPKITQKSLPEEKPASKASQMEKIREQPGRIKEVIIEKKVVKKTGPGILEGILGGLLKLLDFILKAGAKVITAILVKPAVSFYRYLTKKPVRIVYFLIFLLVLYVVFINWPAIQGFLNALKI